MAARVWRPLPVAVIYAAAGLAVYGMTLGIPLISDDFYFLGIVAPATNLMVAFEPLLGRFIRPAVVAVYYISYHTAGVSPWLYHVFTVLPHLVTAWALYLVTRHLAGRDEAVWAFLSGLLFLVFAGHSEAVSWAAGIADPLLGAAMMTALYCYLRAIEPDEGGWPARGAGASAARGAGSLDRARAGLKTRPYEPVRRARPTSRPWVAGFFAALVCAALAKEVWVIVPGVLVAHVLAFGPGPSRRRTLLLVGGAVALVGAYLVMRVVVFGNVAGGYSGLAPVFDISGALAQARAFALRCFVPSGSFVANSWLNSRDLLIWPVAAVALALTARGRSLRMIVFTALATGAALVPVLPLSISVSTTESERYVYLATIFSSPLLVWSVRSVVRVRPLALALCLAIVAAHGVKLVATNRLWQTAGTFTRSIIHSLADEVVRHDPQGTAEVFVLNLADNIGGPFVLRTGFHPALQLSRPELGDRASETVVVATQSFARADDAVEVTRAGSSFAIDLGRNTFVQPQIGSSFGFRITEQTRTSYSIVFTEVVERAIVLYVSEGRVRLAGVVDGPGTPFGSLDLPADNATCEGSSIRLAGWALDRNQVRRVRIEAANTGTLLGEGHWKAGMRPDVARLYRAYPNADRAGWDFELPCEVVRRHTGSRLQVRVVAEDSLGNSSIIGERTIRASPAGRGLPSVGRLRPHGSRLRACEEDPRSAGFQACLPEAALTARGESLGTTR